MVASRFPAPNMNEFDKMADEDPERLVEWITCGALRPGNLTHAAEALGSVPDAELVVGVLIGLTTHLSPMVREGAIYGLEHHLLTAGVRERIAELATDESPGVRTAAAEALENMKDED